ncbi:MAG: hypothetical protein ACXW1T_07970 [Methylophilus sp.]
MKKSNVSLLMLLVSLNICSSAIAESISKDEYFFLTKNIDAEYSAAIVKCNKLLTEARANCTSAAKSNRKISKDELLSLYKPFPNMNKNSSKVENLRESTTNDWSGAVIEEVLPKGEAESIVTEAKPIESIVIPLRKEIFTNQNKSIMM